MDVERRLSWLEHELRRIGRLFDSMTAGGVFNVPQGRTVLGAFEGRPATAYSMDKDGNLVCTTVTADYVLGSLTGQTWQGSGAADMTVDLNRATTGTLYVKNTVTAQSANLDVEGNVTVGGTVDGVDVSAHAANNSAHHAPVTLGAGSAAELSLLGQELILSDVLTPTEHTAIGDSSPHHAAVTLAASADELLGLSTQALSLDVQAAHEVLIGPLTGAPAAPTFRVLDPTDLPALSANPTASVGLTVVNGSASTLMRSDAAPPLSQAIAPTWTGKHTWQPASDAADYLRVLDSAGTATIVQVDTLLKWVGVGAAPIAPLSVTDALQMPQFSIQYDASHYGGVGVDLGGNLTLTATGDLLLDPTGNDVLPATGYDLNLGSLSKKYLTLHAAELWVETLVAQDTIATIGGRILVGPTTVLTVAAANGDTSITVKHNQMSSGDRVYLEADGHVEFMAITSEASGSGPYTYNVTRDLDGTGANDWAAGDAVFNTGQAGKGFIDLYSVSGVKSGAGPTIVGNVRNSATYNDWTEHWAIGNLNGVYGYGTDVFGFAAGKYAANQPWIAADATNGFRIMRYTTQLGQWDTSGNITVGSASTENVYITSDYVALRVATTAYTKLEAGVLTLGDPGSEHISISSTAVQIKDSGTVYTELAGGALTLGQVAGGEYVSVTSSGVSLYANSFERIGITAAGILTIKDSGGNAVFTFNASAGAEFTKPLTIATTGGIYQGTGTFDSPTTGLKIWNSSGVGKIAGYNTGTAQWYAETDGKLYAGGGAVRMDSANAITLKATSAYSKATGINFENSSGDWFGRLNSAWATAGTGTANIVLEADTSDITGDAYATIKAVCASGETAVVSIYATEDGSATVGNLTVTSAGNMNFAGGGFQIGGVEVINEYTHHISQSNTPRFKLYETDANTDQKWAEWYHSAGILYGRFVNDANDASSTFLSAVRGSGTYTVDYIRIWGNLGVKMAPTYTLDVTGNIRCSTGFGCNSKTPQTAYASGGAVTQTAGASYGATEQAMLGALKTLANNIRTALVNNGIMS